MDIRKKISIAFYTGGFTQIAATEKAGKEQLYMWWVKGYVTEPIDKGNGVYSANVVDDKYLSLSFKQKR